MPHTTNIYRENDNIYLNIAFTGDPSTSGTNLEYNVTKNTPLLNNASEYYCSIVRFDIPLSAVPITIMPIVPNQVNPNLSPLKVTISYNGVDYTQSVIFVPPNPNIPVPAQTQPQQIVTPYYFIYTYDYLLNLFNTALSAAYVASGIPALYAPGTAPIAPYFHYDPQAQIISLIISKIFVTLTAPLVAIPTISINLQGKEYLDGFNYTINSLSNAVAKALTFNTNQLEDIDGYALFGTAATSPPSYFKLEQSYNTLQYWASIRKILITTNTLPIVSEYVPGQTSIINGLPTTNSSVNSTLPILTDFTPIIQYPPDSRSIAYYLPTAQYRLVDMISEIPIYKIDLFVFWESTSGNIFPLLIPSYQQANIKIGFFRKSLYKYIDYNHPILNNKY